MVVWPMPVVSVFRRRVERGDNALQSKRDDAAFVYTVMSILFLFSPLSSPGKVTVATVCRRGRFTLDDVELRIDTSTVWWQQRALRQQQIHCDGILEGLGDSPSLYRYWNDIHLHCLRAPSQRLIRMWSAELPSVFEIEFMFCLQLVSFLSHRMHAFVCSIHTHTLTHYSHTRRIPLSVPVSPVPSLYFRSIKLHNNV